MNTHEGESTLSIDILRVIYNPSLKVHAVSLPKDFKLSKRSPQFCRWLQGAFKDGNARDGSKSVHGFETLWQFLS